MQHDDTHAPGDLAGPGAQFFRVAAIVGFLGTLTTASNILIGDLLPSTGGDPLKAAALTHSTLYMSLQWILLAHSVTTLVPPVALAAVRFPTLVGAAGLGALFTLMEKFTEFAGQTARLFALNRTWRPNLLTATDAAVREKLLLYQDQLATVWDAMYFLLWVCSALAAICFAVAFWRGRSRTERWLARTAIVVAALALLMTLADYFAQPWAAVTHPILYLIVMTAYRGLVACVLWQHATALSRRGVAARELRPSSA